MIIFFLSHSSDIFQIFFSCCCCCSFLRLILLLLLFDFTLNLISSRSPLRYLHFFFCYLIQYFLFFALDWFFPLDPTAKNLLNQQKQQQLKTVATMFFVVAELRTICEVYFFLVILVVLFGLSSVLSNV